LHSATPHVYDTIITGYASPEVADTEAPSC